MADIDKLMESIESDILNEEVKLQMAVLFENSLNEAIKAKEEELDATNKVKIEEFYESLTNKIDSYLDLFVEEFTKENTKAIEESVKIKTAERVLSAFNKIVEDFNVQLDEKVVTDEEALVEAKKQLNKTTEDLVKARKEIKMREKAALVVEASSKLETEMQKAKLVEYAKKLPFDELFEKKVDAYAKTLIVEKKPFSKKEEKLVIKEELETPPIVEDTNKAKQFKW
jgi:hypothetical protein